MLDRIQTLRQATYEANMELFRRGLIIYTWGNVSQIDREANLVAIKPSGVAYEAMRPEDIVLLDLTTERAVDSRLKPSSDAQTHLALYRAFGMIGGVSHTHSPFATAWAQAGRPIPCYGTTHADYFRGEVPVTRWLTDEEIAGGYERETGMVIVEAFRALRPADVPAALVAGHGPFTWGKDAAEAVYHAAVLEQVAHMALSAESLNASLAPLPANLQNKHYERKHGKGAYYGQ